MSKRAIPKSCNGGLDDEKRGKKREEDWGKKIGEEQDRKRERERIEERKGKRRWERGRRGRGRGRG